MSARPFLSIVLATYNRRDVVLDTLARLRQCELEPYQYEVIIVDNASTDGTFEALRNCPGVTVRALDRNLGSCAKAVGARHARGEVILFLDDDSFPRPGCLDRMLRRFATDPTLGAAGFTVHLPDGSQECSALPHVFVGCGVGLRARALNEVGGLDRSFFMQAEEYDLSFRLLQAGWRVEIFADLEVNHLKSPQARRSRRTTFHDVCNNLRVIARYLPEAYADIYREDWLLRYRWFAEKAGHITAYERGVSVGRQRAQGDQWARRRWRLSPDVLEEVLSWSAIERRMQELAAEGQHRIVLADFGKNVYAFKRGADRAGLEVLAIADDFFAGAARTYRGIPLVTTDAALALNPQAIVVSNTSYVHAERRRKELTGRTPTPVLSWFPRPIQTAVPDPDAVTTVDELLLGPVMA
jgi:GT2 family glycosyltransferase